MRGEGLGIRPIEFHKLNGLNRPNSPSPASNGRHKMDFAPIRHRFGQPFRSDLAVDRNRNRAGQVTALNHAAPKAGELTFQVFDYFPHCFPGGSRAILASG